MKVLLSLRSDALRVFGGDTLYAQRIAQAVQEGGTEVILSDQQPPPLAGVDLINVINAVNPLEAVATISLARTRGIPVILTPIYDNLDRFFLTTHWKANIARLALGESAGMALFQLKKELSPSWRQLKKLMLSVDHLVAASEREKKRLVMDFDLPPDGVSVVYVGIDPQFGKGARADTFIRRFNLHDFLLTVGRVEPIKNQLSLLRATKGIDVPLVFIGAGNTTARSYLQECRKLAAGRPVHFIDHLPHEELAPAFAAAKAHVAPSYSETTSMVSLEAVLAGCPIVLTKESPYEEYVGPDVITCDPYHLASIRRAVERVLTRPKPTARARERLIRNFGWSKIGSQVAAVYRKVAS